MSPFNQKARQNSPQVLIRVEGLRKVYRVGSSKVHALAGVDLTIEQGEFVAIVGTSGSGKSTLLNMLAGLEPPTKGSVKIGKVDISKLNESMLVNFRREHVGFVFQSFNLIASMTAEENVALPLIFKGISPRKRIKMARRALKEMGLETRAKHRPSEMSGDQMQRVGIARALVVDPKIIFADEPTGNLDSRTSQEILRLIRRISREKGQTVVMVTHDRHLAEVADRIFDIRDGKILNIDKGKYSHLSDEELSILALADEGEDHETA